MSESRKLRVFLCHASQDKKIVHRLYERLLTEGWIEPWLDEENLLPGQDRELQLEEILKSIDVALVCLSRQSLDQEGNFQREIKSVVELAKEKPEHSIFIIPICLDSCDIPQVLQSKQHVNFFASDEEIEDAYLRIRKSMERKFEIVSGKAAESRLVHWASSRNHSIGDDLANFTFGGLNLLKIPKGKFIMGSRASNNLSGDDEHPQRPYEIPYNYWISCFPISNEQFSDYAVSIRRTDLLPKDWKKRLNQPIVNVSWNEVVEYTKWLNKVFKKEIPSGFVFRLPTEAEWERASRGDKGAEWPWGDESLDDLINSAKPEVLAKLRKKAHLENNKYSDNFGEYFAHAAKPSLSTARDDQEKVTLNLMQMKLAELRRSMELADSGTFSSLTNSPFDIADMMGSVWEWTQTLYLSYPYDIDDGRENIEASGERVIRGCFMSRSERFTVRSSKRSCAKPHRKETYLGFRIVIAPPVS